MFKDLFKKRFDGFLKKDVDSTTLKKILGNSQSSAELADNLLEVSNFPHKNEHTYIIPEVMSQVLGTLIEEKYGRDKIKTSKELNNYLNLLKKENYPYLDKARKTLNPNMRDIDAGWVNMGYGGGGFSYGPNDFFDDIKNPNPVIRMGEVFPYKKLDSYTKGVLAHELGHANDHVVKLLKRGLESSDEGVRKKTKELLNRIESEDLLNQVNNLDLKYTSRTSHDLTPLKALEYEKLLKKMPDFPDKSAILDHLNQYKKTVAKTAQAPGFYTIDQGYTAKVLDTDMDNIKRLPGEGIDTSFKYPEFEKRLNDIINHPIKQEILRSSDHHSRYKDIPEDIGFFEFRNIRRLLDNKTLRSIAPLLKTAGKVGLPVAAAAANYAEAKEMGLPDPIAAAYAGAEELNPLPISGIDYYKGVEKSGKGRAENIQQNYMPEEMKVEQQALENYKKSPAAKDRAFSRIRELLK